MISVAEASDTILAHVRRLSTERVQLHECAGRVLAADARSPVTVPPWNNSSMDGYAVRSADVANASAAKPVPLSVVADIPAGAFPPRALQRGEAMRVMTGAPIPDGADSVVRVEDTDGGMDTVQIRAATESSRNVRYAGEDVRAGDVAIPANTVLGAAHVGVLASTGFREVDVYRAPRVAIISSGDELVSVDDFEQVQSGRKIVSSNNYTLAALVRESGGIPVDFGIAADSIASLREKLSAARKCDLILTTAGISIGERDYTRDVFAALGGTQIFWRVRMRPGAPMAFGLLGETPWIGLSGNPVSAMVGFVVFVRAVIRKMKGHALLFPELVNAVAEQEIGTSARLTHFLRGVLTRGAHGGYTARISGSQSSGVMTALARANALLVIPEEKQRVIGGESVRCIPLAPELFMSERLAL